VIRAVRIFQLGLAATVVVTAAGVSALGQSREPDPLFGGARLGMTKAEVAALPVFAGADPGCGTLILPDQPRTQVESCESRRPAQGAETTLVTDYLLAPDQEGVFRVLHITVTADIAASDMAIDALFRRFGGPSVVNNQPQPESIDRSAQRLNMGWIRGSQRVAFQRPCFNPQTFCVDYSDGPYARRLSRAATDQSRQVR
jgi:hypothetical protein